MSKSTAENLLGVPTMQNYDTNSLVLPFVRQCDNNLQKATKKVFFCRIPPQKKRLPSGNLFVSLFMCHCLYFLILYMLTLSILSRKSSASLLLLSDTAVPPHLV